MHTDILVIGTGISGLTYAIKLAEKSPATKITLICKQQLDEGNTRYAQGGIAVVSNFKKDTFDKHIQDTFIAGDYQGDNDVIDFVIREGNDRLKELINWGTQFDKKENNRLDLTKEGGHSEKRIVHFKDHSGAEIQRALIQKVKEFENIQYFENHILVDLITDHHTKTNHQACYGAYIISTLDEEIIKITAQITVLSTGGLGQLYDFTTNPAGATADGLGAAYRAKALLEKLPFVQFHPTALYPKVNGETFLITEALRGEGAILKNHLGEAFMEKYHPSKDLAPRDIVARSIIQEIKAQKSKHVYLDATNIKAKVLLNHFPNIVENCQSVGINPLEDLIPVIPAAHYSCGGIKVDQNSSTTLKGLYAIGECSHTGLHGANRLASNSLLESIVFSHRAAIKTCVDLENNPLEKDFYLKVPDWKGQRYTSTNPAKQTQDLRKQLCKIMSEEVGIFKTTKGLINAQKQVKQLYFDIVQLYNNNKLSPQICELRNMVSVAYVMVNQSLTLTQNNGVFYNHDYATNPIL